MNANAFLPADEANEKAALGCVILAADEGDAEAARTMLAALTADSFLDLRAREVFMALQALAKAGGSLDSVSLDTALRSRGTAGKVAAQFAVGLPESTPSVSAFASICPALKEAAWRRQVFDDLDSLKEHLVKGTVGRAEVAFALGEAAEAAKQDAAEGNGQLRPKAIRLYEARRLPEDHPDMLFRRRVLKRGESWLVTAPTGVGKSVLTVELAMLWALGRGHLGFDPVLPLRSLIFVAEDDEDEMAWFRDCIARAHDLSPEDRATINERVAFVPVCDTTGSEFVQRDVIPNAEAFKPDLLHLNPALAYIGAEANDQAQVGAFLRGQWHPVCLRFKAGSFVSHHTPKPPSNRKQEPARFVADLSYAGLGSVEWSNWPRGILTLVPTPDPAMFRLVAPKRGQRLAWTDADDKPTLIRYVRHTTEPGTLGWQSVTPSEIPKTGRPKSASPEAVLALLADKPLSTTAWCKLANDELGVKSSTFYDVRSDLERTGRIWRSKIDGWHVKIQASNSENSENSENTLSGVPEEPTPKTPLLTGEERSGVVRRNSRRRSSRS